MARKIFVGSLPNQVTEELLRAEFDRFGDIDEIFIKEGCPLGKQWAFVTFASPDAASAAKEATDRLLKLPGAERACDVMLAKNQGNPAAVEVSPAAPRKIFVGSLPDGIQEQELRIEFSKYGSIEDLFIKPGCEPGRQWAFVTFDSPSDAAQAQEATNGKLHMEGSSRPCEAGLSMRGLGRYRSLKWSRCQVTLARNQARTSWVLAISFHA
ncbi:Celf1 [Symbiodinium pilosum]|uniref:Celf1 protein n=1 Tax=Symbiodinium pilosum TaxID=2952 RepID=A0A812KS57_SYMPI|nr:Celf1 [Symbiodinium pilosum]